MRYKELVMKRIDHAETLLTNIIKSMENKSISPQDAYDKIKLARDYVLKVKETVNLEHD